MWKRARVYVRRAQLLLTRGAPEVPERALQIAGAAMCVLLVLYMLALPPLWFRSGIVIITEGESAADIAKSLKDAHIIRSTTVFRVFLRLAGTDAQVRAGTYKFGSPESLASIERRLLTADYGIPMVRLTFVEGFTVREAALQVAAAFPSISKESFMDAATPYEGYLFPDTYSIPQTATGADIIKMMRDRFTTSVVTLEQSGKATGHPISDIVTMASIIEREARTDESRKIVAGILWNRIERNMPLQVDAVFGYIFDRQTYSPSIKDLKVDSPYNTYTHKGLPPGPISNPGMSALMAAARPASTTYLYYLTGKDGLMRYATTYAAHKANLNAYLR
jgi:UPF0755 protein